MPLEKSFLERAYASGLSMSEIARDQKVSLNTVVYWFKNHGIASRTRSEAMYRKKNPAGDPFEIADLQSKETQQPLALGIALYLGEGSKTNHGVRLANSNPKIIRLFINFLIKVCGVKKEKIKAWINMFDEGTYEKSLEYWVGQTGISKTNFYSPIIRKRKLGNYKNKSMYGTITILVDNKKLKDQIIVWCDEYLEKYADLAQW